MFRPIDAVLDLRMFTIGVRRAATLPGLVSFPALHDARCGACDGPLGRDQRYCLQCGERHVALPPSVAALIAGLARADGPATARELPPAAPRARAPGLPTPRVAAVAVMGLLAWGVVLGSAVSPAAQDPTPTAVLLAAQPAAPAAAPETTPTTPTTPEDSIPEPVPAAIADDETTAAPSADDATTTTTDDADADAGSPPPTATATLPAVKHVFLVMLSGHGYDEAFGTGSPAPYLAQTLRGQGELLANYYAVTQGALANQIALISGQGPTPQTAAGCPQYGDVAPGTIGSDGQVAGDGCVYPVAAKTLADQLTDGGRTWKAYVEGVDGTAAGEAATCRHPAAGTADGEQAPRPGDPYVTWRNPFAYFHSLIDGTACSDGDVGLDALMTDLQATATTPSLSYIVPDRCHDGSDDACAPDQPAGLPAADAFLKTVIPQIQRSPGYRDGGLIAVTFDQAPQSGPHADASSCCDAQAFPNLASTTTATTPADPAVADPTATTPAAVPGTSAGGGRVGLLLISDFTKPGSLDQVDSYNHFSLLRSIEDLFGLDHLGYATDPALPAFDKVVYNAKSTSKVTARAQATRRATAPAG
jgi:phospholipase C